METAIFYVIAGALVVSALMVVTLRNLFHCALFLAVTMFCAAGIFLYLESEFLAVVQVLIYVGAVTVLLIFGIMLTREVMSDKAKVLNHQAPLSVMVAGILSIAALFAVESSVSKWSDHSASSLGKPTSTVSANRLPLDSSGNPSVNPQGYDVNALGLELIRPDKGYAFAFELVSILLLSALVGAIVIARKDTA